MFTPPMRLRDLPVSARVGFTFLILTLAGGILSSGLYMYEHHQNRDLREGLTMDDLVGAYHGIETTAPLITSLESGHPDELEDATPLSDEERKVLLDWLNGDQARISADFDNLDLGEFAPAEILANRCADCHEEGAELGDGIGDTVPLVYWEDVRNFAFSRSIEPTDKTIMLASTHTHALALGSLLIVVAAMAICTRWPIRIIGVLIMLAAAGLFTDLAGWWLATQNEHFVRLIVIGGGVFIGCTCLLLLATLIDLWGPIPKRAAAASG